MLQKKLFERKSLYGTNVRRIFAAKTMRIIAQTLEEYFSTRIAVQSALMPKRYKLTPKEQEYLAACAAYSYRGGNLHDFDELSDHLIAKGIVNTQSECSVYKSRISVKKWVQTGRGKFRLPTALTKTGTYDLHLELKEGGPDSANKRNEGQLEQTDGLRPKNFASGLEDLRGTEGRGT